MITVRRHVVVARPAEEVFDFLADTRNEQRWNPNVVRVVKTSTGPVGRGSTFEGRYRRGGTMRFEITHYDRPARLGFRGGGRRMGLVATVEVTPEAGGTAVSMRGEMSPRGVLRLLGPLMRPILERQYADVVRRFRDAIERSTMDNAALYRRWFDEIVNGGDLARADELLADDYVLHFPGMPGPVNREGHKGLVAMFRTAFPDWIEDVDDMIADGDKVVARLTGHGTHLGDFQGIPPTGREVSATGIGIARIAGGRIAEAWAAYDALGLLQQLGAVPAPSTA